MEKEEEDYTKGLEDIDWNIDWSEVEELCGVDSVCCIRREQQDASCDGGEICGDDIVCCVPKEEDASCDRVDDGNRVSSKEFEGGYGDGDSTVPVVEAAAPRFKRQVSSEQVSKAIIERVPKNTAKSTSWGVGIFEAWCMERNIMKKAVEMTGEELNDSIARFVHEAVKKDGCTPYPPNSLYQIVVSIQRHLKESGRADVAFFNEQSATYDVLRKSLDARMKELTSQGHGTSKKSAEPITRDMEAKLWDDGLFSRKTGTGLMNIVYFYNCKLFGLRAGDEHRSLTVDQYRFGTSDGCEYMEFSGRSTKTYSGGLKHRKLEAKSLRIFSVAEIGERDIVSCFKQYISLIPPDGPFYRRPSNVSGACSFTKQVIGKNKLQGLIKAICEQAGFEGYFTGHSGKVTCATELFNNNIDEQLIQVQTGHRSTAVRAYKRPGEEHSKMVSRILQPPAPKKSCALVDTCTPTPDPLSEVNISELLNRSVGTFNSSGNITFNFNFKK